MTYGLLASTNHPSVGPEVRTASQTARRPQEHCDQERPTATEEDRVPHGLSSLVPPGISFYDHAVSASPQRVIPPVWRRAYAAVADTSAAVADTSKAGGPFFFCFPDRSVPAGPGCKCWPVFLKNLCGPEEKFIFRSGLQGLERSWFPCWLPPEFFSNCRLAD